MPQNEVVTLPPTLTHSLDDIERLAEAVAKSRMFGITTKEQAMVLMAISQAEGRHPALAARDYHIIQGKPTKTTEAIQRDFLTAGGTIKWHRLDDTIADATFSHPIGGTVRIDWDHARVVKAGLAGREMHQKYTRAMLRARCVSEGVKSVYPAATSGMYTPEEQADIPIIDTTTSPISAAADLDQFAAASDQRVEEEGPTSEPTPERDILAEARSASLRGVEAFRDYWVALSQTERNSIRSHLAEFEAAAKRADDPFDLPPRENDLLNRPEAAS
jgi:hypothetical protein